MPIGSSFLNVDPSSIQFRGGDQARADLAFRSGQDSAAIANALKRKGVFDRIGDFVQSDEGRAALMRSAGATLQGGLGAGIEAGTNFYDQRRAQAEDARRFGIEEALKGRGLDINQQTADQTGQYQQGQLGLGMGELEEKGRHNRAGEGLEQRQQDVTVRGQNVGAKVQMRGQDVDRANNVTSNATSRANNVEDNSTQRFGYSTTDKRERDAWTQDPVHVAAGIGSKVAGTRVTKTKTPARIALVERRHAGDRNPDDGGADASRRRARAPRRVGSADPDQLGRGVQPAPLRRPLHRP
jgi:hypothetical protein